MVIFKEKEEKKVSEWYNFRGVSQWDVRRVAGGQQARPAMVSLKGCFRIFSYNLLKLTTSAVVAIKRLSYYSVKQCPGMVTKTERFYWLGTALPNADWSVYWINVSNNCSIGKWQITKFNDWNIHTNFGSR